MAVMHLNVSKLFTKSYKKSATVAIAEHGLRITGIFYLNINILQVHEFAVVDSAKTANKIIRKIISARH